LSGGPHSSRVGKALPGVRARAARDSQPALDGFSAPALRAARRAAQRNVITYTGTLPEAIEAAVVLHARILTVSVLGEFKATTIIPAGIVAPACVAKIGMSPACTPGTAML
jgi:hypothetical protein